MENEVKISGFHHQIGTINQAETINITEKPFLRELKEKIDHTLADLEQAFEFYPNEEKKIWRNQITHFRIFLRDEPERIQWIQRMLEQMTCLETEPCLDKVPHLIQFLLLLRATNTPYTLENERNWMKVFCAREKTLKKFALFDRGVVNHPIRIIGPQVVRFILESGLPMSNHDVALIWRNNVDCAEECKDPRGIIPVIVPNFVDVSAYQEDNPSFFDEALGGQLHITCGTCLMDVFCRERSQGILERMFAL